MFLDRHFSWMRKYYEIEKDKLVDFNSLRDQRLSTFWRLPVTLTCVQASGAGWFLNADIALLVCEYLSNDSRFIAILFYLILLFYRFILLHCFLYCELTIVSFRFSFRIKLFTVKKIICFLSFPVSNSRTYCTYPLILVKIYLNLFFSFG